MKTKKLKHHKKQIIAYKKRHNLTQQQMARLFDFAQSTISGMIEREREGHPHGIRLSPDNAFRIEKLTRGEIDAMYLLRL